DRESTCETKTPVGGDRFERNRIAMAGLAQSPDQRLDAGSRDGGGLRIDLAAGLQHGARGAGAAGHGIPAAPEERLLHRLEGLHGGDPRAFETPPRESSI